MKVFATYDSRSVASYCAVNPSTDPRYVREAVEVPDDVWERFRVAEDEYVTAENALEQAYDAAAILARGR